MGGAQPSGNEVRVLLQKFYGGVHPNDHKSATNSKAITPLKQQPAQVVIPMAMHTGAPCKPLVEVGQEVRVGQRIGETTGLGAPIHASVSGKVTAVEPRPNNSGTPVLSVVIENDFQDTPAAPLERPAPLDQLTPEQIVALVRDAGITGMGGASFPTHVKLSGAIGKADTCIINGAECEPYITADHRLMLEQGERIIGGARILKKALGLDKVIIGVEENKMDAVEHLKALTGGKPDVVVEPLHTRYPQGAEKQLIQRITGREVPPGGLPADVGCCVFNVGTAAAVYDAVHDGKPLTHRVVTVTGSAVKEPGNFIAPIGTLFSYLVEQAGGFREDPARVISGGPMMGVAQYELDVPMVKATNCVLCYTKKDLPVQDPEPACLRCGRCVNVCPMHLTPLYMHMYAEKENWEKCEKLRVMDCMECGSCNYICPARIPLVQSFRLAKPKVRALAAKKKEAK